MLKPAARKAESQRAAVLPFPLVPAMWTVGSAAVGVAGAVEKLFHPSKVVDSFLPWAVNPGSLGIEQGEHVGYGFLVIQRTPPSLILGRTIAPNRIIAPTRPFTGCQEEFTLRDIPNPSVMRRASPKPTSLT